jgi:regulator of sigma E protease
MCVVGALDPSQWSTWLVAIPWVALGLGAVIFVHELGHFAVAKMCGVKCEKFFIGFDIGGYKLSRQWGETEYGIGILPLGGYVKMMGQDDNPANIAEQVRESQASADTSATKEIIGPDGQTYVVDRRSYLAKSVPQRMAIISAGVIMNVIFAFIFATIAFGLGVPYIPALVTETTPGSPAWRADVRPGDEIVKIDGIESPSFNELRGGVTLGDLEQGIPFVIERGSVAQEKILKPERDGGLARIGIFPASSLKLHPAQPVALDSPADVASKSLGERALRGGDELVAVEGQPVANYAQYAAVLVKAQDRPLRHTFRRGDEEISVEIGPHPMRRLGLVMEMGTVVGVQEGSPAARLDPPLEAGDFIERFADTSQSAAQSDTQPWDPITTPERLRRMGEAFRSVDLTIRRGGSASEQRQPTDPVSVALREADWLEPALPGVDAVSAPALGVAYRVLDRVESVLPGSAAEKMGLQGGDRLIQAELIFPDIPDVPKTSEAIEFGKAHNNNWAGFIAHLQQMPGGTQVKLTYQRGEQQLQETLTPQPIEGQYVAKRGLQFAALERIRKADTFSEQVRRGWNETTSSLGMVYRFLSKLGGQIPFTSLGGPVMIAKAAGYSALDGAGKLLTFLTMLSANLAVINFLPIPLLDGGHMVFLTYEGIRGRPATERFVVAMHTIGFVFIISLMLFVLSLDFGLIPRNL